MSFHPKKRKKQARAVIFSRKLDKLNHPSLNLNKIVTQSAIRKHLAIILNTKLDFQKHLKGKLSKISKSIG